MSHGGHHSQTVAPSIPPFLHFSSTASYCFILDRGIWQGMNLLGHFGPPLLASFIYKGSESFFYLHALGLLG